jgi:hypothetical protein
MEELGKSCFAGGGETNGKVTGNEINSVMFERESRLKRMEESGFECCLFRSIGIPR